MGSQHEARHAPVKPLAATAAIFFVAEVAVMGLLSAFPVDAPPLLAALLDSALLVLIGMPVLWFFVIRPFYRAAISTGQKWENLLEAAPEGIFGVGRDGKIRFANRYAERVFGYPPAELVGQPIEHLIPQRFAHRHVKLREQFFKAPSPRAMGAGVEVHGRRRDGSEFPAHVSLNLIPADGESIVLTIVRDVSSQKQIENELRMANEKLLEGMEEAKKNARILQFLMEFGAFLQRCSTEEELYSVVSRHMQRLFPERAGAMFMLAPTRDIMEPVNAWGADAIARTGFPPDACWAVRRGQIHRDGGALCSMPCSHVPADAQHAMCVPLIAQEGVVGILHFVGANSENDGTQQAGLQQDSAREHLFLVASEQVTMALVNLRLRAALHEQSIRDPLTRLYNRRHFEQTLEREVSRTRRTQRPLSVIMLDVDHFKRINDRYGHDGGDEVLKAVSRTLLSEVRAMDSPCRIGGEEFCIVAPDSSLEEAGQMAERLRQRLKEIEFALHGHSLGPINASFGVAEYPRQAQDAKELLTAADTALYKAKEAGRDRIVLAFKAAAAA